LAAAALIVCLVELIPVSDRQPDDLPEIVYPFQTRQGTQVLAPKQDMINPLLLIMFRRFIGDRRPLL